MISQTTRRLRPVLAGLAFVVAACGPSDPATAPDTTQPAKTVTGVITTLRADTMSVRADDGRELIFSIADAPTPHEELRSYFRQQTKLEITYETRSNRLVPTEITIADP